jgi:CBS domain-containing protein
MTTVGDLMTRHVITIEQDRTAHDAAKVMHTHNVGCLIVVKDGNQTGIITERDLVRRVCVRNKRSEDISLDKIMSRPVITIDPESSIEEAARIMTYNKIRRLLVVKEERPVGVVTTTDLAKHLKWGKTSKEVLDEILRAIEREES